MRFRNSLTHPPHKVIISRMTNKLHFTLRLDRPSQRPLVRLASRHRHNGSLKLRRLTVHLRLPPALLPTLHSVADGIEQLTPLPLRGRSCRVLYAHVPQVGDWTRNESPGWSRSCRRRGHVLFVDLRLQTPSQESIRYRMILPWRPWSCFSRS